jgi:hypothetical protein
MREVPNEQVLSRGRSSQDHPKSLHLHNLNHSDKLRDIPMKDTVISDLMIQLATKLK